MPRAQPRWIECTNGSPETISPEVAGAIRAVEAAYEVMAAVTEYVEVKDRLVLRGRFEDEIAVRDNLDKGTKLQVACEATKWPPK